MIKGQETPEKQEGINDADYSGLIDGIFSSEPSPEDKPEAAPETAPAAPLTKREAKALKKAEAKAEKLRRREEAMAEKLRLKEEKEALREAKRVARKNKTADDSVWPGDPHAETAEAVSEEASEIPVGETVSEEASEIPVGETVSEEASEIPVGETVSEEASEIPVEETVSEEPVADAEDGNGNGIPDSFEEEILEAFDAAEEARGACEAVEETVEAVEDTESDRIASEVSAAIGERNEAHHDPHFTAITSKLTAEHDTELMAEDELDDQLLLALGYKNAEHEEEEAEKKPESTETETVFAIRKEFSDIGEREYITDEFKREKRKIEFRIAATAVCALLLLVYPLMAKLLAPAISFFDTERFFGANVMVSLDILLLGALFSAPELWRGFTRAFAMKPNAYSAPLFLIVINAAGAFTSTLLKVGSGNVTMYMFFASVMLLVPILKDYMLIRAQMRAFDVLTGDRVKKLELRDGEYILSFGPAPSDLLSRLASPVYSSRALSFSIFPLLLLTAIAGLLSVLLDKDTYTAITVALTFASLTFPLSLLFSHIPFYVETEKETRRSGTSIIGHASLSELESLDAVSLSDSIIFDRDSVNALNAEIYNSTSIYDVMYSAASVLAGRNTSLSKIFSDSAEEMELSEDVSLVEENENGLGAIVDGRYAVLLGNRDFFDDYDISLPASPDSGVEGHGITELYLAINGKAAAYFALEYRVSEAFKTLSDNARMNGVRLTVYSDDFCVTKDTLMAKLHLTEDELELKHGKLPRPDESSKTAAATTGKAYSLFLLPDIARATLSSERILRFVSVFLFAVSILLGVGAAVFTLPVSQYVITLCQCIFASVAMLACKNQIK